MVHLLKVYVSTSSGIPEIRRFTVNSEVLSSFHILVEKILTLMPRLMGKIFELCWKDSDDDYIVIANDDDLAQAVANSDDEIVKLYVRFVGADAIPQNLASADVHSGVQCDSCGGKVSGHRYKCLQCDDYDLCIDCNNVGKHPFHDMLKLVTPSGYSRQWVFHGWRRLFRSMFGRDPVTEMVDRSEWAETVRQMPNIPPDEIFKTGEKCMKNWFTNNGDLVGNINRILTNALGPLGVDVKIDVENPQGKASGSESEKSEGKVENIPPSEKASKESVDTEASKLETPLEQPKTASEQPKTASEQPKTASEQPKQDSSESTEEADNSKGARPKSSTPEKQVPLPNGGFFVHNSSNLGADAAKKMLSVFTDMQHPACTIPFFVDQSQRPNAFSLWETNGSADGWTVINAPPAFKAEKSEQASAQTEKSDPASPQTEKSEPASPKTEADKPTFPKTETKESVKTTDSCQFQPILIKAAQEVHYPKLEKMASKEEKAEATAPPNQPIKTEDELPELTNLDPEVANALIKMRAMGFTNEGGWLLRLLQAKKGNIYAALDSLYPNQQRP